jgi:hypothetical protein
MPNGSIDDDSEPLVIKTHAPLQIENIDMRINVLKEYLLTSPDATMKDLKKALVGYSKYTDDEFKELVKSVSQEKYNELYPSIIPQIKLKSKCGGLVEKRTQEEINFLEEHRNYTRKDTWAAFKLKYPDTKRKLQFVYDYYHLNKNPVTQNQPVVKKHYTKRNTTTATHVISIKPVSSDTTHILAHVINSLYKSGKSPKTFSEIKPVIELIKDPNAIDFAIECLTS